jgi:hypothetical protein
MPAFTIAYDGPFQEDPMNHITIDLEHCYGIKKFCGMYDDTMRNKVAAAAR